MTPAQSLSASDIPESSVRANLFHCSEFQHSEALSVFGHALASVKNCSTAALYKYRNNQQQRRQHTKQQDREDDVEQPLCHPLLDFHGMIPQQINRRGKLMKNPASPDKNIFCFRHEIDVDAVRIAVLHKPALLLFGHAPENDVAKLTRHFLNIVHRNCLRIHHTADIVHIRPGGES